MFSCLKFWIPAFIFLVFSELVLHVRSLCLILVLNTLFGVSIHAGIGLKACLFSRPVPVLLPPDCLDCLHMYLVFFQLCPIPSQPSVCVSCLCHFLSLSCCVQPSFALDYFCSLCLWAFDFPFKLLIFGHDYRHNIYAYILHLGCFKLYNHTASSDRCAKTPLDTVCTHS